MDEFVSLSQRQIREVRVVRLNLSVAHLEAVESLVHLHFVLGLVANGWLARTPSARRFIHQTSSGRLFSLPANVSDGRVEVLPERLDLRHVFPFALLSTFSPFFIGFLVNVSRELLAIKVVDDSVRMQVVSPWLLLS